MKNWELSASKATFYVSKIQWDPSTNKLLLHEDLSIFYLSFLIINIDEVCGRLRTLQVENQGGNGLMPFRLATKALISPHMYNPNTPLPYGRNNYPMSMCLVDFIFGRVEGLLSLSDAI